MRHVAIRLMILSFYITVLASCSDAVETATDNKIDARPPVTTATATAGQGKNIFAENESPITISGDKAPIIVSLKCSDDLTGCDPNKIYVKTSQDEAFVVYDAVEKITINKSTTLEFYAIDYAGYKEDTNKLKYVIDYAPIVNKSTLSFSIANNIMAINWEAASDPGNLTPSSSLLYRLYYHTLHDVLTLANSTLDQGIPLLDWSNSTNVQIDLQNIINARDVYWQVLVKDSISNYSTYNVAQFPAATITIKDVTISSALSAELLSVSQLGTGQLNAYLSIDNNTPLLMTISDQSANLASKTLPDLTPITHNITVTYEFKPNNQAEKALIISQVNREQDFSTGLTLLEFTGNDLSVNYDADNDGSSNIQEILAGTNPFGMQWTLVSGNGSIDSKGEYGEMGVPVAGNTPGARTASVTWVDNNNQLWLFGGIGYDSGGAPGLLNDMWRWDGNNWTWISGSNLIEQAGVYEAQTVFPGARQGAVSWVDNNNNLWLFGGIGIDANSAPGKLNDLWRMSWDGVTWKWTWVSGCNLVDQGGICKGPSISPSARYSATTWAANNGEMWLFGGTGWAADKQAFGLLNDLWRFEWDGLNVSWTLVAGSTSVGQPGEYNSQINTPGSRMDAMSWTDSNNDLWLFGGFGLGANSLTQGQLNDLWKLSWDGTTWNWTWIAGSQSVGQPGIYNAQINMPGARKAAITWSDNNNQLWLFGGHGLGADNILGELNDLWVLSWNGSNWTWNWISGSMSVNQPGTSGTANDFPGARYDAVSWRDLNGQTWLFGGTGYVTAGSIGRLNDLWQLGP